MLKLNFILLILASFSSTVFAESFTVMTYNVENLFNTTHDEGKDDWAYLPKASKGKGEQAAFIADRKTVNGGRENAKT